MRPSFTPDDLRRERAPEKQREKRSLEVLEACEAALRKTDGGKVQVDFDSPDGTADAAAILGDHGWFVSPLPLPDGKVRLVICELVGDPSDPQDV